MKRRGQQLVCLYFQSHFHSSRKQDKRILRFRPLFMITHLWLHCFKHTHRLEKKWKRIALWPRLITIALLSYLIPHQRAQILIHLLQYNTCPYGKRLLGLLNRQKLFETWCSGPWGLSHCHHITSTTLKRLHCNYTPFTHGSLPYKYLFSSPIIVFENLLSCC